MKTLDELEKVLPHGSGIDYNWELEERGKYIYAENAFHYMNEEGFYDGVLPFTIKFYRDGVTKFDLHFHVNGVGRYRVNKGSVREYIENTIFDVVFHKFN